MIKNLIYRAKLIPSSKTIFYSELENIKQTLSNDEFLNYVVDEQIKNVWLKISTLIAMEIILHQTSLNMLNYFFITTGTNTTNLIK